ncbi:AAA family ATPase [Rhodococcus hoagii]|nr:AAA family ATPase [Prescottella equi]ORL41541.1 hypothetical protein A6F59_09935 [Prescottella equi]
MGEFKSEIRDSEIESLSKKVSKNDYGQYLRRVTLKKVRQFTERSISFDFPVTALVGPNGGGKTTVLGSAGLLYKEVKPRRFFAKSGDYDASMKDWSIECEVVDKSLSTLPFTRSAKYRQARWARDALKRSVLIFGVDRTVPATERSALDRAVGNRYVAKRVVAISAETAESVESILDKDIQGYNTLEVSDDGRITMFSAAEENGNTYSEFHFGAGEASVIRIVLAVEAAPKNSLILIEEIENGLHPIATRRMVEYLIKVALRKSCQVIFTTHSNDALDPLPESAIWAAYRGQLVQGKLDVRAMRTITGQVDAKLAIFVEDEFARDMTLTVLRAYRGIEIGAIKIHPLKGAGTARTVHLSRAKDPDQKFPSIALLDGDQGESADPTNGVFVLPGDGSPELHIFDAVNARIDDLSLKLAMRLGLDVHDQTLVQNVVQSRGRTNHDRHTIFEQIGHDLFFITGKRVGEAFLEVWAADNPDEVRKLVDQFASHLPMAVPEDERDLETVTQ